MRGTFTSPAPRVPGDPTLTKRERFAELATRVPTWDEVCLITTGPTFEAPPRWTRVRGWDRGDRR